MKSALLVFSIFAVLGITLAAPTEKTVYVEDNEIPDKRFFKKGATAEFGGLRASAGLGNGESGGALFAVADFPGANANAGIGGYGSSASASAGAGSSSFEYGRPRPPVQAEGGFFDRIFAIPINVLHSVNQYVKTKAANGQGVYIEEGGTSAGAAIGPGGLAASANAGAGVDGTGLRFGSEENSASASASASAGGIGTTSNLRPGGRPDYDKIFNIPISALKSVNDLLNG